MHKGMEKMDTVETARLLGKAIQADERYKAFAAAKKESEEDTELQDLIGQFNLANLSVENEMEKEEAERDAEKIREYNTTIRQIYGKVMCNDKMIAYNKAKAEFELMMKQVNGIIELCTFGEDPDTCDPSGSCTGDCSSCGGCH